MAGAATTASIFEGKMTRDVLKKQLESDSPNILLKKEQHLFENIENNPPKSTLPIAASQDQNSLRSSHGTVL